MTESAQLPINLKAREDLVTAVKAAQIEKWQDENREAFAAYDKRVESKGVFSAGKRLFR